ncbi:MAG: PilZ domain-containing protein [Cellvibrionaceae bacterium]
MADERLGVRTPFRSRIRVSHRSFGYVETETTDISDSGVYLILDKSPRPEIGDVVEAQVLDLPFGDAPLLQLQVVRSDGAGLGLRFL